MRGRGACDSGTVSKAYDMRSIEGRHMRRQGGLRIAHMQLSMHEGRQGQGRIGRDLTESNVYALRYMRSRAGQAGGRREGAYRTYV